MTTPTVDHRPIVTFETMLRWKAEDGKISTPFTPDEKDAAIAVARAYFFAHTFLEELPEQAGLATIGAMSWSWGIRMVCERRAGRI